jgi:hypothetical protein
VHELTDPTALVPEAVAAIESRFPAADLAGLEPEGDWRNIEACRLVSVWMPGTGKR